MSERGKRPATWYRWQDLPREELHDRLSRRLITGDRVMLAQVYLKKGCVVPAHKHENEQITCILDGALKFEVHGKDIILRKGDVLHIPPNVVHAAIALEDTLDVDVFSPPRQDWLDGTDDYLRGK